jgi:hypothetical protein
MVRPKDIEENFKTIRKVLKKIKGLPTCYKFLIAAGIVIFVALFDIAAESGWLDANWQGKITIIKQFFRPTKEKHDVDTMNDSLNIVERNPEFIEQQEETLSGNNENEVKVTPPPKEIIKTITDTGTGFNFHEDQAIELAKDNALNNLKNRHGLTDAEIRDRSFSIQKIDSLRNGIRVTVIVSGNITVKQNE